MSVHEHLNIGEILLIRAGILSETGEIREGQYIRSDDSAVCVQRKVRECPECAQRALGISKVRQQNRLAWNLPAAESRGFQWLVPAVLPLAIVAAVFFASAKPELEARHDGLPLVDGTVVITANHEKHVIVYAGFRRTAGVDILPRSAVRFRSLPGQELQLEVQRGSVEVFPVSDDILEITTNDAPLPGPVEVNLSLPTDDAASQHTTVVTELSTGRKTATILDEGDLVRVCVDCRETTTLEASPHDSSVSGGK